MVSRCSRIAGDANSKYSVRGNRMMSGVSRSSSAPWALLPCCHTCSMCRGCGFVLYSPTNNQLYNTYVMGSENPQRIVGSSQGWVSCYDRWSHELFLLDPLANRVIELPPLVNYTVRVRLHAVVAGEDGRLAVATFVDDSGSNLVFYSLCRISCGWIRLVNRGWGEKKRVYDGVAYSSRHKRLFCITSEAEDDNSKLELECWDLDFESPRVEETMEIDLGYPLEKETEKFKYLVLAEHTDEMYVMVRYVANRRDLKFDVYKIDREGEGGKPRAVRMEDSLEGLAMFVGSNHGFALAAEDHSGLNPNCLYFGDDSRLDGKGEGDRMIGKMLDYQNKKISPLPIHSYDNLQGCYPDWFVPRPT